MPYLGDGRWVQSYSEAKAIIHGKVPYIPFQGYPPQPPIAPIKEEQDQVDRVEPRKWAYFHLYLPIEKADDSAVSRLNEHIRHHFEGVMNYIEDMEASEDTLDTE